MKAVINPGSGIYKNLTEEQYRKDEQYLKADGFRLMNEKEIVKHFGYQPEKKSPEKDTTAKKTKAATKTK